MLGPRDDIWKFCQRLFEAFLAAALRLDPLADPSGTLHAFPTVLRMPGLSFQADASGRAAHYEIPASDPLVALLAGQEKRERLSCGARSIALRFCCSVAKRSVALI